MLIKPFVPLLKEQVDATTMSYIGNVVDNNDPKKFHFPQITKEI